MDKLSIVTGLLYFVNFKDRAPTSVFEKISNKLSGTSLPFILFGFIPNWDSLKLKRELDNEVGGLLLFFNFNFSWFL